MVALPGAYGKPRPAVVVQADRFNHLGSIIFLPFTSDLLPAEIFRMADKCSTLPLVKVGSIFGRLGATDLGRVDRALAAFLGFV